MRRLITCPSGQAGIHNNPVEEGYVFRPEDYLYSSAADYAGEKGLLDNVIVVKQHHAMFRRDHFVAIARQLC